MKNRKELGQHWLKNRVILDRIASLAVSKIEQSAYDFAENRGNLCIEIGPGLGTLTSSLLKRFDLSWGYEYVLMYFQAGLES